MTWNPHKVEMALWAHFVVGELKKELLDGMPGGLAAPPPGAPTAPSQQTTENGESQTEQQPQKEKNVNEYFFIDLFIYITNLCVYIYTYI